MADLQISALSASIKEVLAKIGEDPNREGLAKTPERYARALDFLTSGYSKDPKAVLNGAIFHESYDEMVVVKDIEVYSLCEHHLLPFFGKAHIAYIPNGKIVGLSKVARLVEVFARRLQVQERMTTQIAETLDELLQPRDDARSGKAKFRYGDKFNDWRVQKKRHHQKRILKSYLIFVCDFLRERAS